MGLVMNETKINIIKKVLNIHEWELREDRERYPYSVFALDRKGKIILELNNRFTKTILFSHPRRLFKKIRNILGFYDNVADNTKLHQVFSLLIKKHYGWERFELRIVGLFCLDEPVEHIGPNVNPMSPTYGYMTPEIRWNKISI